MTSNSTADGHSQTGSQKQLIGEQNLEDRPKNKSNEGFVCLHTGIY